METTVADMGKSDGILILTSSFPRYEGDYAGAFVQDTCEALLASGYTSSVISPSGRERSEYQPPGIPVHRFDYFLPRSAQGVAFGGGIAHNLSHSSHALIQLPFFLLQFARRTVALSRDHRIMLANWLFPSGIVGAIAKSLTKTPLVMIARGSDVNRASGVIKRGLIGCIARRADAVICVSDQLKRTLIECGVPPDRVHSFPDGVDAFDRRFEREPCRVSFIGRLVEGKGVEDLLHAVSSLSEDHFLHLDVAGDGPLMGVLKSQTLRIQGPTDVRFLGRISRDDVPDLMSRSSILALPSLSEGLPDTILTAMACGTSVLSTRIPGVIQVVEDGMTGILVQPSSKEELTLALQLLIENPVFARRLGSRGTRSVLKRFQRPQMVMKLVRIIRSLVTPQSQISGTREKQTEEAAKDRKRADHRENSSYITRTVPVGGNGR